MEPDEFTRIRWALTDIEITLMLAQSDPQSVTHIQNAKARVTWVLSQLEAELNRRLAAIPDQAGAAA